MTRIYFLEFWRQDFYSKPTCMSTSITHCMSYLGTHQLLGSLRLCLMTVATTGFIERLTVSQIIFYQFWYIANGYIIICLYMSLSKYDFIFIIQKSTSFGQHIRFTIVPKITIFQLLYVSQCFKTWYHGYESLFIWRSDRKNLNSYTYGSIL